MLAAAAQPDEGWGKLLAMLGALAVAWLATELHQRWMARGDHSPTPPGPRPISGPPAETDDPDTDDTDDPGSWWGSRIRLADGSVLVRRAAAVWRTGSHQLPEDDDQADVDEVLVDELEEGETREETADRLVQLRCRYADAVREIMAAHDVSESTAKRDLAAAQKRLG